LPNTQPAHLDQLSRASFDKLRMNGVWFDFDRFLGSCEIKP